MKFREYIKENITYFDGGMGTLLQKKGMALSQRPERINLTDPDLVTEIHKSYITSGADVITANTFGANLLKYEKEELEQIISAAISCAKRAREEIEDGKSRYIAMDIGPLGRLLKPLGDMDFEEAVSIFSHSVRLGAKHGADLILIETVNDCYETKAALLAAKESCDLPVAVTNAYGEDGKLLTGATPAAMVAMLEGMGADLIGANCSLGPDKLLGVVSELVSCASVPVLVQPNAGLPSVVEGKTLYNIGPSDFSRYMSEMVEMGVSAVGGCCGTTPEYISATVNATKSLSIKPVTNKGRTVVSSYNHAVAIGSKPVIIGERINPTGKSRFKQALLEHDIDYILSEGIGQSEKGADILDVNVGLPGIDEGEMISDIVYQLQSVCNRPLQIDTSDPEAMEKALRIYNGKAMINSVNGKAESMDAIFPLVKKYGGVVIALTLDENGIPSDAKGRYLIAKKIVDRASALGIDKKNIIVDPLAMTVSADPDSARTVLDAVHMIREQLEVSVSLGVSNISFGLPERDTINSTFFAQALCAGLDCAIINPYSEQMMRTYRAHCALHGHDLNFNEYIAHASLSSERKNVKASDDNKSISLKEAIVRGLKDRAAEITSLILDPASPLDLINEQIIPALDTVGAAFERREAYLPQLLMSAEASKAAFEVIKKSCCDIGAQASKATVVLATVECDIHDIGKNIVKLILENYGYKVVDLGKDVKPNIILNEVVKRRAEFAGLSALMTTTVPYMEKTVALIKEKAPWCKVMVGGAVLNCEYAEKMGADFYAKDAMDAVRYLDGK